ncbi:MAG: hypothetical protein ACRDKT_16840, partial [Actinomycetota bacterium]
MSARLTSLVTCLVLFGVSCSGGETTVRLGAPPQVGFSTLSLPPPTLARPGLRVNFGGPAPPRAERAAARWPGVAVVVTVKRSDVRLSSRGRSETARVMWVDPIAFRSMTSPVIRDSELIWLSLVKGDALVAPRMARRLDVAGGDRVKVAGEPVDIGAVADAWRRHPADVILNRHIAPEAETRDELLIGLDRYTDLAGVLGRLRARFDGARVERLRPDRTLDVTAPAAEDGLISPMAYRILEDGFIEPSPAWVRDNIATETVPILGEVSCHRLVLPQLRAALE